MIYLKWMALVVAAFLVDIAGLFAVPIAIAFSNGRTLPAWAWPWDNDREPLGDADRRADIDAAQGLWRGFLRWRWLCLRNPGNNFGYRLGFVQAADIDYAFAGDPLVSDQGHAGWLFVRAYRPQDLEANDLRAFCFYGVWRWAERRCLRVMLGWKIHDMSHDGTPAQLVCVVNPVMTFEAREA